MNKYAIFGISIVLCIIACAPRAGNETPGKMTGTITFIEVEGGFYGIITDDGARYDPINLPDDFKKDGLRIRFNAQERKDQASFHMWGILIELTKIEKVEDAGR